MLGGYLSIRIFFIYSRNALTSLLYPGKYCHLMNFILLPNSDSFDTKKYRK